MTHKVIISSHLRPLFFREHNAAKMAKLRGKVLAPNLPPIGQIFYSGIQKSPVGAGAKAVAVVVGRQQQVVRRQLDTAEVDEELGIRRHSFLIQMRSQSR